MRSTLSSGSPLMGVELNGLEYQVDQLLTTLETLKNENKALRHKLTLEKKLMQENNQKLSQRIQKIIEQLRETL